MLGTRHQLQWKASFLRKKITRFYPSIIVTNSIKTCYNACTWSLISLLGIHKRWLWNSFNNSFLSYTTQKKNPSFSNHSALMLNPSKSLRNFSKYIACTYGKAHIEGFKWLEERRGGGCHLNWWPRWGFHSCLRASSQTAMPSLEYIKVHDVIQMRGAPT